MTDFIQIEWASGSLDEARLVSRYLIQERLVACAQIVPWIESIYIWDNNLKTEQECKVLYKTRRDYFQRVLEAILANAKYEVPEVVHYAIEGGHKPYLDWIAESLSDSATEQNG